MVTNSDVPQFNAQVVEQFLIASFLNRNAASNRWMVALETVGEDLGVSLGVVDLGRPPVYDFKQILRINRMAQHPTSPKAANYGIDAPEVVLRFFVLGLIGVILWLGSIFALKAGFPPWAGFIERPGLWMGCSFLVTAGVMLWGSKIGKLRLRDKVVSQIPWRGDEMVLDVGCGHGLLLIAIAKRLRSGKAIGIDLWQREDQAGNSREATWQNVQLENVAAQVELRDGDARKLPFSDNTFEVVVSSWALHNIYDQGGRETALREIVRILKPGGCIAIIDIRHTDEYARVLQTAQMLNVRRTWPNFLFVIPTYTVTASKPSDG